MTYKIIFANALVTFSWGAAAIYDLDTFLKPLPKTFKAIALLAVGVGGGVAINIFATKAALSPVVELSNLMSRISNGRFSLRGRYNPWGGKIMRRCVDSLNQMLDVLESERRNSRSLAKELMSAQEEERRRIAREIHDETNQVLATLGIRIERLKRKFSLSSEFDLIENEFDELEKLTAHILAELRRLAFNLRPTLLDNLGLHPALSWLFREHVEKHGVQVFLTWEGPETRLPGYLELAVFRISQEAATNIIKHSKATTVRVHLRITPREMSLDIKDNGVGFDSRLVNAKAAHMGIFSMKERTVLLHGEFILESSPNAGTSIQVSIPFEDGALPQTVPQQEKDIAKVTV